MNKYIQNLYKFTYFTKSVQAISIHWDKSEYFCSPQVTEQNRTIQRSYSRNWSRLENNTVSYLNNSRLNLNIVNVLNTCPKTLHLNKSISLLAK